MNKYRVRLPGGRVVGPFLPKQIIELKQKGHISGREKAQKFPSGDWKDITSFDELNAVAKTSENKKSFIAERLEQKKQEDKEQVAAKELSEKKKNFKEFEFVKEEEKKPKKNKQEKVAEKKIEIKSNEDKTVVNPETLKYLEEEKERKKREEEQQKKIKEEKQKQEEQKIDLDSDSTQVVSLKEIGSLKDDISQAEKNLEKEKKQIEINKKIDKEDENEVEDEDDDEGDEDDESDPQKKKKKVYVYIAALVFLYFIFSGDDGSEKTKEYTPNYPSITFPTQWEEQNEQKAKEFLIKGNELLKEQDYMSLYKASIYLNKSLENQFDKNEAISLLLLAYSKLLKNSSDIFKDSLVVYKLLRIVEPRIYEDKNILLSKVIFFYYLEKFDAVIKTVDKFLNIASPTPELFAYYLKALIKVGSLTKAKKVYEKIDTLPTKEVVIYTSQIDFLINDSKYSDAADLIIEARKSFPNNAEILLRKANLLIYNEDFESLESLLKNVMALSYNDEPRQYARYLEYLGLLNVYQGKYEQAVSNFKKSLQMYPSVELRKRLASLESIKGNDKANELILESKSLEYIRKAEKYLQDGKYELAFTNAINATDIYPSFIPAQIILSEVQIKKGFFQSALKTLERLNKKNPGNREVVFTLIDAYIESYKLSDANQMLSSLSTTEVKDDYRLWMKYGKLSNRMKKYALAVSHYQTSIKHNPVNDRAYFKLGQVFLKYKKFSKAKSMLQKAIDLDPSVIDYRLAYGEILYETDGADTAVGYLRDILQDFKKNQRILADIGIYYYRSGQIKYFKEVKEQLSSLPEKDISLYEFLVTSSLMDERFDEVIDYGNELLKLDPGNLEVRMMIAKILLEQEKHTESLEMLKSVSERLDSYPKLKLYKSRLFMLIGEKEQAIKLAQEEIKNNPGLAQAYVHLGDIYRDQEEIVAAEQQYKKARQISPNDVDALLGMAFIHFKRAQYEISLDLYKKAKKQAPERASVYKQLGDVYRHIGQGGLAIEAYKTFLELDPNSKYKKQIETYIRMLE